MLKPQMDAAKTQIQNNRRASAFIRGLI